VIEGVKKTLAISSFSLWRERLVYSLLFLFPLFGVSLNHWFSSIYVLIFIVSLTCFMEKKGPALGREERILLYLIAGYFMTFILSAVANEWAELQTRYLGVEIRYLAAIPIYLMIRNYTDAPRWLLAGVMIAALIAGTQAYCDVSMLNKARAWGVYSPNLLGSYAAILAVWLLIELRFQLKEKWWLIPLCISALLAVALSGSRGAYLGLLMMGFVIIVMTMSNWRRYTALAVMVVALALTYMMVDEVKDRVDIAVVEVGDYLSKTESVDYERSLDGTAVRFEMWRFVGRVFVDKPIFGIGRGNYVSVANEHIQAGTVHPDVGEHAHPHNAYAEALISRGAVGLSAFLLMLFYPLYYFFSTRSQAQYTALLGVAYIVGFMVFSLTDASTFIKGNFSSVFLLFLVVIFSWHVREVRAAKGHSGDR